LDELRKAEADLRRARRKAKSAARQSSGLLRGVPKAAQEHCSVEPEATSGINDALTQNLGAVYANLPSEHRALFESQLKRLVGLYRPLARGG
jgi:aromatic ring hydroxylase